MTTSKSAAFNSATDFEAVAAKQSAEACLLSQCAQHNEAIGTVFGLDAILEDVTALYSAVVVLHRLKAR